MTEDTPTATDSIDYEPLAECVKTDPDRRPVEQEISITMNKADDHAAVYSAYAGVARRLLRHPLFALDWYITTEDGDGRGTTRRSATDFRADGHDQRKPVYAVSGTIPHQAVGIKGSTRRGGLSEIVSGHRTGGGGDD